MTPGYLGHLLCICQHRTLTHRRPRTERHASIFRDGRSQAVRIPRGFEFEGSEVLVRKEGDRLILTPIKKSGLLDLLATWEPMDDELLIPDDDSP